MSPAALPIKEISQDKRPLIPEAAQRWIAVDAAKGPVDREMAEYALSLLYAKERPYLAWVKTPLAAHLAATFMMFCADDPEESLLPTDLWAKIREHAGDDVLKDVRHALESSPWSGRGVTDVFDRVTTGSSKPIGELKWNLGTRATRKFFMAEESAREIWWQSEDISVRVLLRVAEALGATNTADLEAAAVRFETMGEAIRPGPSLVGWFPRVTGIAKSARTFIETVYVDPYDAADGTYRSRDEAPTVEHACESFSRIFHSLLRYESWHQNLPLIALWHTSAEVFGDQLPTEYGDTLNYLEPHRMLAENIGYVLPFSNLCILSDRPE